VVAVAYTGPGPGGIYARMAEAGVGPKMLPERLTCRPPTSAEVTALSLPRGSWVIAITRRAYTAERRCVEVNEMVLDASAYELEGVFEA
jgi:GntR family transcriptional regulator